MWIQQPKADAVSETDALRAQLDDAKAQAEELKTKLSEQEAKTRDVQERCVRLAPGLPKVNERPHKATRSDCFALLHTSARRCVSVRHFFTVGVGA